MASDGKSGRGSYPATLVLALSLLFVLSACDKSGDGGGDSGGGGGGPGPTPLQITTASLPTGTSGTAYSTTLQATGGTPGYMWGLLPASDPLPTGMTLSFGGVLSGTPTQAGTFALVVRVQDSAAPLAQANANLSLTINSAPPPPPNGTFGSHTAYAAGNFTNNIGAADFFNDGKPDILVSNQSGTAYQAQLSLLPNTGTRTFGTPQSQTLSTIDFQTDMAVADLNADGKPDAAFSGQNGAFRVYGNDGSALVYQSSFATSFGASGLTCIAIGDVSGDGQPDIVIATKLIGTAQSYAQVFKNNGAFSFTAGQEIVTPIYPMAVVVADLNGDARRDVAVVSWESASILGNITVFLGANTISYLAPPVSYPVGLSPLSLVAGDFNGDTFTDFVVSNSGDDTLTLMLGSATGALTNGGTLATGSGPYGVAAADFNADGKADLAVANYNDSSVSVLLNNSGSFAPKVDYAVGGNTRYLVIADFDTDGRQDIAVVCRNGSVGSVSVLYGN
ncbi:MAG: hypothetical protein BroJett014_04070 [Planctomycetota bacterium]|nr:MAG: hypothetical protein BroJett014_04070 [Planctomycetota bacterium]